MTQGALIDRLKNWNTQQYSENYDLQDDLFGFFEGVESLDPWDVAEKGRELYGSMFEECEQDSAMDNFILAIAVEAHKKAIKGFANMLGLDASALHCAVSEWTEQIDKNNPPKSITIQEFVSLYEHYKEILE